ncbi:MAG: protein GlmU, partial [Deltaproteobacteria bacterium]|nr:protein GlmU [Deltaproteobacteria bacterium]
KATASLIGDVSRGVMLRQKPIFLGGQGGLVGPCRLEYGTIIAAGTICRKDELRPDRLIFGGARKEGNISYKPGFLSGETRIIKNNIEYIANLFALMKWYKNIRSQFISDNFPKIKNSH